MSISRQVIRATALESTLLLVLLSTKCSGERFQLDPALCFFDVNIAAYSARMHAANTVIIFLSRGAIKMVGNVKGSLEA